MKQNILELKNISKSFSDEQCQVKVLSEISFEVGEREIVCLMGPSGCGKSTLVRIIAGLETADEGLITGNNQDNSSSKIRSAMVFQEHGLFPWLSVYDNIAYGMRLKVRHSSEKEIKERVNSLLSLVHLEEFARSRPYQISGGMKQRVAVARALAIKPEIVLMDEPFSALDPFTRRELEDEVIRIRDKMNTTFLVVTHNPDGAVYISDKIVILSSCPATVDEIIQVPFEYPRDPANPEFIEFVQRITKKIRGNNTGSDK